MSFLLLLLLSLLLLHGSPCRGDSVLSQIFAWAVKYFVETNRGQVIWQIVSVLITNYPAWPGSVQE